MCPHLTKEKMMKLRKLLPLLAIVCMMLSAPAVFAADLTEVETTAVQEVSETPANKVPAEVVDPQEIEFPWTFDPAPENRGITECHDACYDQAIQCRAACGGNSACESACTLQELCCNCACNAIPVCPGC